MPTQKALITSRDSKGMQAVNIFEAAYNQAKLDNTRAQRLNERGGKLKDGISKLIAELSISDTYADEEIKSTRTYPEEYGGPKPIEEQIRNLAEILSLSPDLAHLHAKSMLYNQQKLPTGAEGWFAIPSDEGLVKLFPHIEDYAERYCAGVRLVHDKIVSMRRFYNYLNGQITPNRLRINEHTAFALDIVARNQPGDILIVAGQLGMRHRGRSVRRARECFDAEEFGLGALAVGSIVLTHPNRITRWAELDMDCSGDDHFVSGRLLGSPVFFFNDDQIMFEFRRAADASGYNGPVSAFIPQP